MRAGEATRVSPLPDGGTATWERERRKAPTPHLSSGIPAEPGRGRCPVRAPASGGGSESSPFGGSAPAVPAPSRTCPARAGALRFGSPTPAFPALRTGRGARLGLLPRGSALCCAGECPSRGTEPRAALDAPAPAPGMLPPRGVPADARDGCPPEPREKIKTMKRKQPAGPR